VKNQKQTESEKKCLYLVAEEGKWVGGLLKPLKPIYNGAGWFLEEKHRVQVEQVSQEADMRLLEWPLDGETFEELRRKNRNNHLNENAIKTRLIIDGLKATLGISQIDNKELVNGDLCSSLEQTTEGKQLIENLKKYDYLQGQIKLIDEEIKISKINVKENFSIAPYTLEDLQKELSKTKEGLKTGYAELDDMFRIPNEAITLIGGRPSHGKTTFMLNLFLNLIDQYPDLHFYFFSYEETRQQIAVKIINILSGWLINESQNIINIEGYLRGGSSCFPVIERGKNKYQELVGSGRLRIVGEPFYVHQLPSIISSLKSQVPLGAVFIDYIQKIKNNKRFGTRQLELANTSSTILEAGKTYSIPIILGAQFGRDKESKNKVKLDNLREAGDLEQDANLVLGLFNPSMEKAQEDQSPLKERKVDLNVTPLKNRNGIVNKTIVLEFDRPILQIKSKVKK
jgi:replicative DNA helicase